MEPNRENTNITRKKFLRICGSVVAGGSILGVAGNLIWKMFARPGDLFFGTDATKPGGAARLQKEGLLSPYRLVSAFKTPDRIEAFELYQDKRIIAVPNNIYIYDPSGTMLHNFSVGSSVRDMAVANDCIYLLYPTRLEVYTMEGERVRDWEACSDESDYCSLAVAADCVFVTDAANKNICKYTSEGGFVRFIQSPNGFIVPSYAFGITVIDGTLYCSNPGRHLVESYSLNGDYIDAFGKTGGAAGGFSGCCNPVYLSATATGEIITSEKGIPRISCYGRNGEFHTVLLDSKALGGGHAASEVRVWNDQLLVAGEDQLSTFQYDTTLISQTACADCAIDCPLRVGVTI